MTPEAKTIITNFLNENNYKFQLSIASGNAGATVKDVTNWRQRNLLPYSPDKIGGRFFVTAKGFIAMGIMSELSWALGPDTASKIASTVIADLFLGSPFRFDVEEFLNMTVEFQKPLDDDLSDPQMMEEGDFSPLANSGFRLRYGNQKQRNISPRSTLIILPIGQLVAKWAIAYSWADTKG